MFIIHFYAVTPLSTLPPQTVTVLGSKYKTINSNTWWCSRGSARRRTFQASETAARIDSRFQQGARLSQLRLQQRDRKSLPYMGVTSLLCFLTTCCYCEIFPQQPGWPTNTTSLTLVFSLPHGHICKSTTLFQTFILCMAYPHNHFCWCCFSQKFFRSPRSFLSHCNTYLIFHTLPDFVFKLHSGFF